MNKKITHILKTFLGLYLSIWSGLFFSLILLSFFYKNIYTYWITQALLDTLLLNTICYIFLSSNKKNLKGKEQKITLIFFLIILNIFWISTHADLLKDYYGFWEKIESNVDLVYWEHKKIFKSIIFPTEIILFDKETWKKLKYIYGDWNSSLNIVDYNQLKKGVSLGKFNVKYLKNTRYITRISTLER